jgi:hypothetical protein
MRRPLRARSGLDVDVLVPLDLRTGASASGAGGQRRTHPVVAQHGEVALGEVAARLVRVDALGALAALELVAHDARLHRAHPRLADVRLARLDALCGAVSAGAHM